MPFLDTIQRNPEGDLQIDYERRFGEIIRFYRPYGLERFEQTHICVIGIGGVGSVPTRDYLAETFRASRLTPKT